MAQQNLIDTVANGCKAEIEKYCANVTPGEGRMLACLYAHEDKLSGRCEFALYDASVRLERPCRPFLCGERVFRGYKKHCSRVETGKAVFWNVSRRTMPRSATAANRRAGMWA